MTNKLIELTRNDLALSVEHTNSLCNVCDVLHNTMERMEDMKTENVCQLNIYESKQKNWLELRQKFLDNEIKSSFSEFYQKFLNHMKTTCDSTETHSNSQ